MIIKRILSWPMIIALTVLAAGVILIAVWHADRELREGLLQQSQLVSKALNVEYVMGLTGTKADLENQAYRRIKEQIVAICSASARYRFIYLMGRKPDGTVVFLADSEDVSSSDYSPPGEVFENPTREFLGVFDTGVAITEGIVSDRWGSWMSALVPIINPANGAVVAVLGVDVRADVWRSDVAVKVALPVGVMFSFLIMALVGFAAVRRVSRQPRPVLRRLLAPIMTIVLILTLGSGWLLFRQYQQKVRSEVACQVRDASEKFRFIQEQQASGLSLFAGVVAVDHEMPRALFTGETNYLLKVWMPVFKKLRDGGELSYLSFIDSNRVCVLRCHRLDLRGDVFDRYTIRESERTGKTVAGLEMDSAGMLTLMVVAPVVFEGRVVGYVEVGKKITDILCAMEGMSGSQLAVTVRKEFVERDQWECEMRSLGRDAIWGRLSNSVVTAASQGIVKDAVAVFGDHSADGVHVHRETRQEFVTDGRSWRVAALPFNDASGREVGDLLVMRDITEAKAEFTRLIGVFGGSGALLVMAVMGFVMVLLYRTDKGIRAQQADLEASEESYRNQFAKNSAVMLLTGPDGKILDANAAAEQFYGYKRDQLLAMSITDINPISLEEVKNYLNEVRKAEPGKLFQFKHHLVDGSVRDVEVASSIIQFGSMPAMISIVHDISERKRAEEALRESETLLNEAGELAKVGGWKLDVGVKEVSWTRETYLIHEVPEGEPVELGRAVEFYDPEDRPIISDAVNRALTTGESFDLECRLITAKGRRLWVRAMGQAVKMEGKIIRVIGTFQDITEVKRDEAYRLMESDILRILNESVGLNEMGDFDDCMRRVLAKIKGRTGFDAVGIRIKEGEDFPYFAQDGLSKEFLEKENSLVERGVNGEVCRDKNGNLRLECTCGLVISGAVDTTNPFFTLGGSFWANDAFPLLGLTSEQDPRYHPRNECIHQGYASVALVPIRAGGQIVGLLHFNDRRKDCFTRATIVQFESLAAHIGEALMRKKADDQIRQLLDESNQSRKMLLSILEDETTAKASLTRLMAAIEHSSEVIVITDLQGLILYVNPAFEKSTGYKRDEAIGQNPRVLKSGKQDAIFYQDLWATIANGETWHGQFVNRKKNGSLYTEEATISPVKDEADKIVNYVAVKRDITEELRKQEQLAQAQRMESVGRLAGGVAHDFNNLLMGIMGYADLCRDALPAEHPIRHYLDEITKGSQRSADLTRQLLAFARKQTIIPKVLDLNEIVSGMRKLLARLIGEDINLIWKPDSSVWPVRIDPSQMDQILANLCVNARDAISGVGVITITTSNCTLDQDYCLKHNGAVPGDYVRLRVQDNGVGMSEEVLGKVFEPFFTTKESGKGTGLGLATVYGIVKQNNGYIDVISEVGKGTTFNIYLPRVIDEVVKAPVPGGAIGTLPRGSETILLVEDERSLRVTSGRLLETLGYKVLAAEEPTEALDMVAKHSGDIHLLLTDVIMPGMNGRQLAERLLKERRSLKCLFMSGYTANVLTDGGNLFGKAIHFIQKPFPREELARKVREVLDGK